MYIRSEVRHTCYRKKNGQPYKPSMQYIIDDIESLKNTEKWEDFSDKWDVFVTPAKINLIIPEIDDRFIRDTCTKIKTLVDVGLSTDDIKSKLDTREENVLCVVELNYAGQDLNWSDYDKTWGTRVIYDSNRFEPYQFATQVNEIPEPVVLEVSEREDAVEPTEVSNFEELSEEEKAKFMALISKL